MIHLYKAKIITFIKSVHKNSIANVMSFRADARSAQTFLHGISSFDSSSLIAGGKGIG
jgi:hypothetical protein